MGRRVIVGNSRTVAIVGAGFSGTMLAARLLDDRETRVVLIERAANRQGRGVAYASSNGGHLLNVRASNMSAFADRPRHFVDWLERHGEGDATSFVKRATYGDYLQQIITGAVAASPDRFVPVDGVVVSAVQAGSGIRIRLEDGSSIDADTVVLAVGNLPPHNPPGPWWANLSPDRYQRDPWSGAGVGAANGTTILLGTGLTAIDVALSLADEGHAGPILALSRRGLRPHRHVAGLPAPTPMLQYPAARLSAMVQWAREASADADWRLAVDSIRGITPLIWSGLDQRARLQFLRHLRPFWDVHRHRLAPQVADRIDALVAGGKLRFAAGKVIDVSEDQTGITLTYRSRGSDRIEQVAAARIVNCTGPQGDVTRSDDPLLAQLLGDGAIRADALRIGIDVDGYGQVIGREGAVTPNLFALGPMTRGAVWEAVAVPDIRTQCAMLARRLCNSHWIGGEGL